jgi:hypothetical protein
MQIVNFDSDGIPLQTNGDAGDAAGRAGDYHVGAGLYRLLGWDLSQWPRSSLADWDSVRSKLILPDGTVLRYTQAPYNNPADASRDQTMPLMISCVVNGTPDSLQAVWNKIKSNEMRFQNGDLCGPEDIAIFEIGLKHGFFTSEEVFLGAAQLWGSAVVRCLKARQNFDDVGDDINQTIYSLCMELFYPDWPDTQAAEYYAANRPCWDPAAGKIISGNGVQYAWDRYFRPETFANPFNELYRPLIAKYFPAP